MVDIEGRKTHQMVDDAPKIVEEPGRRAGCTYTDARVPANYGEMGA